MNNPVLSLLQSLINRGLRLDEGLPALLRDVAGRTVLFTVRDTQLRFFIRLQENGILVEEYSDEINPDVFVEGSLADIFAAIFSDKQAALFQHIRVVGDVAVLQSIQKSLTRFSPNWQEPLARVIGRYSTYRLERVLQGLQGQWNSSGKHLLKDAGDYLHYEKQWLPDIRMVEHFCNEVDRLRSDVDRLELHLHRVLENRNAGNDSE